MMGPIGSCGFDKTLKFTGFLAMDLDLRERD